MMPLEKNDMDLKNGGCYVLPLHYHKVQYYTSYNRDGQSLANNACILKSSKSHFDDNAG